MMRTTSGKDEAEKRRPSRTKGGGGKGDPLDARGNGVEVLFSHPRPR